MYLKQVKIKEKRERNNNQDPEQWTLLIWH